MPPVLQQCGSQLSSACGYELVPWMMNMTSEAQLMQCATAQRGNLAPMCQELLDRLNIDNLGVNLLLCSKKAFGLCGTQALLSGAGVGDDMLGCLLQHTTEISKGCQQLVRENLLDPTAMPPGGGSGFFPPGKPGGAGGSKMPGGGQMPGGPGTGKKPGAEGAKGGYGEWDSGKGQVEAAGGTAVVAIVLLTLCLVGAATAAVVFYGKLQRANKSMQAQALHTALPSTELGFSPTGPQIGIALEFEEENMPLADQPLEAKV